VTIGLITKQSAGIKK